MAMTRIDHPFRMRPLDDEDGGGWLIEFPDLPGCMSDGETPEEALRNGADALECWMTAMREAGRPIPPPSRSAGRTVSIPDFLYRLIAERAHEAGTGADDMAGYLLVSALARRAPPEKDSQSDRARETVEP
jgi:antitoxin HicB